MSTGIEQATHQSIKPFKSSEEYLYAMKEDLAEWLTDLYGIEIDVSNILEILETGSVLCFHANNVTRVAEEFIEKFGTVRQIQLPKNGVTFVNSAQPATFLARDNISNFINWCRQQMDIKDVLMFETDDLVLRKNEKNVVLCLLEVARRASRFGMAAPVLIQLEQEIEEEIQDDLEVTPLLVQPQRRASNIQNLDEMVQHLISRCTCPSQFPMIKVSEGKYRVGDSSTLIFVRILRSHVMVRVGGGWDTLEHYLDKHDPCRCTSLSHKLAQRPATPVHEIKGRLTPRPDGPGGTQQPSALLLSRHAQMPPQPVLWTPSAPSSIKKGLRPASLSPDFRSRSPHPRSRTPEPRSRTPDPVVRASRSRLPRSALSLDPEPGDTRRAPGTGLQTFRELEGPSPSRLRQSASTPTLQHLQAEKYDPVFSSSTRTGREAKRSSPAPRLTSSLPRPVKRCSTPEPHPQPYRSSTPQSYRSSTPQPQPQPYRSSTHQPQPQSYRSSTPQPQPQSYRSSTPQPQPQPYRSSTPQPQPQPYRSSSPQAYRASTPQPYRSSTPQPQPQPYRSFTPQPQPQPYRSFTPQPQPQPYRSFTPQPQRSKTPLVFHGTPGPPTLQPQSQSKLESKPNKIWTKSQFASKLRQSSNHTNNSSLSSTLRQGKPCTPRPSTPIIGHSPARYTPETTMQPSITIQEPDNDNPPQTKPSLIRTFCPANKNRDYSFGEAPIRCFSPIGGTPRKVQTKTDTPEINSTYTSHSSSNGDADHRKRHPLSRQTASSYLVPGKNSSLNCEFSGSLDELDSHKVSSQGCREGDTENSCIFVPPPPISPAEEASLYQSLEDEILANLQQLSIDSDDYSHSGIQGDSNQNDSLQTAPESWKQDPCTDAASLDRPIEISCDAATAELFQGQEQPVKACVESCVGKLPGNSEVRKLASGSAEVDTGLTLKVTSSWSSFGSSVESKEPPIEYQSSPHPSNRVSVGSCGATIKPAAVLRQHSREPEDLKKHRSGTLRRRRTLRKPERVPSIYKLKLRPRLRPRHDHRPGRKPSRIPTPVSYRVGQTADDIGGATRDMAKPWKPPRSLHSHTQANQQSSLESYGRLHSCGQPDGNDDTIRLKQMQPTSQETAENPEYESWV